MPDVTNQATLQSLIAAERRALEAIDAAEAQAQELIEAAHAEAAERLASALLEADAEAQQVLDRVRERCDATAVENLEAAEQRIAAMQARADANFERAVQRVVAWVTAQGRDV